MHEISIYYYDAYNVECQIVLQFTSHINHRIIFHQSHRPSSSKRCFLSSYSGIINWTIR